MSSSEIIWSLGLLAIVLLALQTLKHMRRGTEDRRASVEFKARLPAWVRRFETLAFCALGFGTWLVIARIYFLLSPSPHAVDRARQGAGAVYFALGSWSIALPLGLLYANLLSWLLPPVRTANLRAMAGLPLSLWSMNRGLVLFGAISIPFGFAVLCVAGLAPWGR